MTAKNVLSGFDYTDALHVLCRDICKRVKEFRNIDTERIGYSFIKARNKSSRYGRWASMTPLRFENGSFVVFKDHKYYNDSFGRRRILEDHRQYFKIPVVYDFDSKRVAYFKRRQFKALDSNSKIPLLYIFNVVAPRFMDELSVSEKIETVMHELFHIDPNFNGDVRRFPGRNWQHSSKVEYDERSKNLAKEWLATEPDPKIYNFLKYRIIDFEEKYGEIYGTRFKQIRLVPISREEAFKLDPTLKQTR